MVVSGDRGFLFDLEDRCDASRASPAGPWPGPWRPSSRSRWRPQYSCWPGSGASADHTSGERGRNRRSVVQTAGRIIGDVVGRDELCQVLIEDLRDPATRRPHVVVGGVGTGKTALLVRLTELLAERGAVPVPVGLRNAQYDAGLPGACPPAVPGRSRRQAAGRHRRGEGLAAPPKNDQIVVLADGLEEALIDGDAEKDRDNLIRLAIHQANDDGLPLIVASRPHDPLREMEAAIIDLEPLSEEAALDTSSSSERGSGAPPGLDRRDRRRRRDAPVPADHPPAAPGGAHRVRLAPAGTAGSWTPAVSTGRSYGCGCWTPGARRSSAATSPPGCR